MIVQIERRLRKLEQRRLGSNEDLRALSDEDLIAVMRSLEPLTANDTALVASFRAACDRAALKEQHSHEP